MMKKKLSARELELNATSIAPPQAAASSLPAGEAMVMLVRRGLKPKKTTMHLPFPEELDAASADRLSDLLGHYAFRLFLRGAIQKSEGFQPLETTRYLTQEQSGQYAEALVEIGLAVSHA